MRAKYLPVSTGSHAWITIEAASENGLQIASLAMNRPSLDEVFLKYTGHELREEEGGADAFRRMSRGVRQARR